MNITNGGFFQNGEHLEHQIGKKFNLKESRGDTQVFQSQNLKYRRNQNLDIVKKIMRSKKIVTKTKLPKGRKSLFRKSRGFRVGVTRRFEIG